ncbi:MAG TPA: TonB family protein [Polyangiaceae bacterium]|nr:TonB family protein [Polyangiaceae bacterium]
MPAPRPPQTARPPARAGARLALAIALSAGAAFAQEIVPPEPIVRSPAHTPADVRLERPVEVVLTVTVSEEGKVTDVEVAASGGHAIDAAAIDAARAWEFRPATRGGKPVRSRIRLSFPFAPTAPKPEAGPPEAGHPEAPHVEPTTPGGGEGREAAGERAAETVTIYGRPEAPSRGAGDHEIVPGELRQVPRRDAAELLRLAPGVFLTNEGGAGHPYQVFLRGFDAREGQDIEFSVDGVPINEVGNVHGNGLADTHFLLPELVESLRVIEGPFAPQQGNFAVAGSARYALGLARRGYIASATAGSFNTKRGLLLWGPEGTNDHTFAGAEAFKSDGFGQNRNSERASAIGSYEGRLGPSGTFRLLGTSYATHYSQAGLLRLDDERAGRKGFYDTYDFQQGGDSSRHSVALSADGRAGRTSFAQNAFVTLRDYRLRTNFTGFLLDVQRDDQAEHPQRGDLLDQRSSIVTLGGRGHARSHWQLLGHRQELELGYFARFDKVESEQRRNRFDTTTPYDTDLRLDSALANLGLYADASVRPLPFVTLRGGVRHDLYHYRVTNLCAVQTQPSLSSVEPDTECYALDRNGYRSPDQTASTAAGIFQPRATLLVGPFDGFLLSVSHGLGSRSLDPQYVGQGYDTPFARVRATEGGVLFNRSGGSLDLSARSVFFQTRVDRDLFFNQTEGRNTLAGGTTRTGWAGNARATGRFFDVAANLTLVRATFDDTKLVIPYAPDLVARLDAVVFDDLPWALAGARPRGSAALGFSYVGRRPLPYDERSQVFAVVDGSINASWKLLQLGLICTNLLDRRYRLAEFNYASDFRSQPFPTLTPARHFNAGEPRAFYATLTLHLEPAPPSP